MIGREEIKGVILMNHGVIITRVVTLGHAKLSMKKKTNVWLD